MSDTTDPDTLRRQVEQSGPSMVAALLADFQTCSGMSWVSAVLAWTYHSLCFVAHRGTTDIAGCTLLLMSWIYQRFSQWCPPDRQVYMYPMTTRLIGLTQQSRDQHEMRVLRCPLSLDQLLMNEFVWMPYNDPILHVVCPPWFIDEAEWGTWMSVVSLVCFNIVEFHQVDRAKCQFNGEQPVSEAPINVNRFLTSIGRDEDVWWPDRLVDCLLPVSQGTFFTFLGTSPIGVDVLGSSELPRIAEVRSSIYPVQGSRSGPNSSKARRDGDSNENESEKSKILALDRAKSDRLEPLLDDQDSNEGDESMRKKEEVLVG
ncbi:hypothetical protein Ahy_B03g066427 [Arachis hypogaea]|uniref:Aminotransferase-like plant mobile domain-containing protein n=1 Tax=Arachis hypogaea TaxID=3818 RepID=A0A445A481_ARAHY|nr:hypothetical protein Ahy_B03g066427 [Arachis hypogaea]